MKKRIVVSKKPLGSVFNPHRVGIGYRVEFEYDPGSYFECELQASGELVVRTSGQRSDLLATHHHVANSAALVARRWNQEAERYVDLVRKAGK